MTAQLTRVQLPDFGMPEAMPELPPALYTARVQRLRERAEAGGYDRLVIYADREHSANVAYLTGFDPRFEEAILIVGPTADPALLVGNECYAMASAIPLPLRRHLFQDFSLPSQPRDRSQPLDEILGIEGIARGSRVGVIGWKTYAKREASDAPAFLVDELRRIAGPAARSKTRRTCSSTPPTVCGSSTRWSSWRISSGPPARRLRESATWYSDCVPGSASSKRSGSSSGTAHRCRAISC